MNYNNHNINHKLIRIMSKYSIFTQWFLASTGIKNDNGERKANASYDTLKQLALKNEKDQMCDGMDIDTRVR